MLAGVIERFHPIADDHKGKNIFNSSFWQLFDNYSLVDGDVLDPLDKALT